MGTCTRCRSSRSIVHLPNFSGFLAHTRGVPDASLRNVHGMSCSMTHSASAIRHCRPDNALCLYRTPSLTIARKNSASSWSGYSTTAMSLATTTTSSGGTTRTSTTPGSPLSILISRQRRRSWRGASGVKCSLAAKANPCVRVQSFGRVRTDAAVRAVEAARARRLPRLTMQSYRVVI